ncbi:lipoate--protein ligase [Proteiniborus sp. MB09-C3]|uniref:lipoate--protein ligase n=1 Tax=Proteiniborus sp. MB09-C3 TaxID=3050072 RepID=UPI0025551631|nr:lipoate--protein ligase [Proteiniborus sp. MB09-C3]WIV13408.1 lipoate--protein ligase [Proteiniborus sp. MB09-C3]
MLYIKNESNNPYFNLALEEYALKNLNFRDDIIILWINEPTVVIGRNQNTIEEINSKFIKEHNINVVRRMSGGGAVYHDHGNVNYTFITSSEGDSANNFRKFTQPVIDLLDKLGVKAEFSGRNDITIDGKKVSGTAQYYFKDRMLHHGAILFNTDLNILKDVLNVKLDKIESKGIKSVRSRVANVYEYLPSKMSPDEFKEALSKFILSASDENKEYVLTDEDIAAINKMKDEKYSTWEWVYGESPNFDLQKSKRYAGGGLDIRLNIQNGIIKECKIFGDFFGKKDKSELEKLLIGTSFKEDSVRDILNSASFEDYFYGITIDDFIDCMFFE